MSRRLLLSLLVLVLAAMALAEVLLDPPSGDERLHLAVILAGPVVVTAVLVPLLRRWVSGRASVAGAALAVGLCSLALGAVSTSAASNAMFLSSHDYRLFLVVLLLSCGIALVVGAQLTHPLARDIERLGQVAELVGAGDRSVRSGIDRRDEVGAAARAIDSMVQSLADADEARTRATAARQQMFASIGHDLRTPLAAMRAAVESLQDGIAPDPDRYLAVVAAQVGTMESLLDQFVQYARIESGDAGTRATASITEIAHEAVEALQPLAHRRHVQLCIEAHDPAPALVSATEVSRVVRNLLDNAIRHSPSPGVVRVAVSPTLAPNDGVELIVRDDGPGFPAEFRAQAFDPFTRADPARPTESGHAGLGLAISRALVENHGGRIWIDQEPGGSVHMWIPRTASGSPAPNPEEQR